MTPRLVQTRSSALAVVQRKRADLARRVSATETYLAGKREGASRNTMLSSLEKISSLLAPLLDVPSNAIAFPWHEIDLSLAAGLRSRLQADCALATANKHLSALRGVLLVSTGLGLLSFEEHGRVLMGLKHIKGHTEETGRALPRDEIEKLFAGCDLSTGLGKRDALTITLLFGCGLRCSEAVMLDMKDVRREKDRASLLVNGKGGKQRRVFLVEGALELLDAWIKHRGVGAGALLLTEGKRSRRPTQRAIYDRVTLLAKKAGIEHVAPHDLRRTFVTSMLKDGFDLKLVSELVGHSQLQTTGRYDKRPEESRREVHETFLRDRFKGMKGTR